MTDEGEVSGHYPFTGSNGKVVPHPALRATFPRGGRLLAEASPIGGKLSLKVTDEGRVAVAAHLPDNDGRSPLIRPCEPPSPEGEGF